MFDQSQLNVMAFPCRQCLFSPNRIVDADRKADILATCKEDGTHFVCHRATLGGFDAVCAGFYARFPHHTPAMRLAAMFPRLLRFVEETNGDQRGDKGQWRVVDR